MIPDTPGASLRDPQLLVLTGAPLRTLWPAALAAARGGEIIDAASACPGDAVERARSRLAARRMTVVAVPRLADRAIRDRLADAAERVHAAHAVWLVQTGVETLRADTPGLGAKAARAIVADAARAAATARTRPAGRKPGAIDRAIAPDSPIAHRALDVDARTLRGPFDLIGDVHGCLAELVALLERLGYRAERRRRRWRLTHPGGRIPVFLGDLCDRGPASAETVRLAMDAVGDGHARAVLGNHDDKLRRALLGNPVHRSTSLTRTIDDIADQEPGFAERALAFLDALPIHLVLDAGRLVAAHAGLPAEMHLGVGAKVRRHALYGAPGDTPGPDGRPTRNDWSEHYRGAALVVHGHVPVRAPAWSHRTLPLDTGACFGGHLSALRYPELELRQVRSAVRHRPHPLPDAPRRGAAPIPHAPE